MVGCCLPTTWDWARYMLHLNTPKAAKLIKFNQTASCWLALATIAIGHKSKRNHFQCTTQECCASQTALIRMKHGQWLIFFAQPNQTSNSARKSHQPWRKQGFRVSLLASLTWFLCGKKNLRKLFSLEFWIFGQAIWVNMQTWGIFSTTRDRWRRSWLLQRRGCFSDRQFKLRQTYHAG